MHATERRVALRITWVGTHKGEFQGIAATGKKVKISGTNIYRFEEDRIAEAWQLYDVAGFLRHARAQKYYVQDKSTGHVGGVFIFDSKENLKAFRDSELAKSTGEAYKFLEPPTTRVLEIAKVLRAKENV